jgi:hypothetical protein
MTHAACKHLIDRNYSDMVDPSALEQADAASPITDDIQSVSLADADAALYGTRGPEASPEKKAFRMLETFSLRDPSTWTTENKAAVIDYVSQVRRWLDDLEDKAK